MKQIFYAPDDGANSTAGTGDGTQIQTQTTTAVEPDKGGDQVNIDEVMKKLSTLEKGYNTIQSNYDKLFNEKAELEKRLKKKEQENLSEKELKAIQEQELKSELERQKNDLATEKLNFEKSKLIAEKKWDIELIDRLQGNDLDMFSDNVDWLNKFIKAQVDKEVNDRISKVSSQSQTTSTTKATGVKYSEDELRKLTPKEIAEDFDEVKKSAKAYGVKI